MSSSVALRRDDSDPGLWRSPAWSSGQPGTFALIIGVSSYPHLKGGDGPRGAKTYGLEQLGVSALTAYRFFRWLRDTYRNDQSPLAEVRLLLSPTPAEVEFVRETWGDDDSETVATAPVPTLSACKGAISGWARSLKAQPLSRADDTRALFFFSGHGLEVTPEWQLLLPSDYLAPEADGSVNEVIGLPNLRRGLQHKDIHARDQILFIDACRESDSELARADIVGDRILVEPRYTRDTAPVNCSVVWSTEGGHEAWSWDAPGLPAHEQATLFGAALLDGLAPSPHIRNEARRDVWGVYPSQLVPFLTQRLADLHSAVGSPHRQRARIASYWSDEPVVLQRDPPPAPAEGARVGGPPDPFFDLDLEPIRAAFRPDLTAAAEEPAPDLPDGFGSDADASAWDGVRAIELQTGAPTRLHTLSVAHDPALAESQVMVEVAANEATWVEVDWEGTRHSVVLPALGPGGNGASSALWEIRLRAGASQVIAAFLPTHEVRGWEGDQGLGLRLSARIHERAEAVGAAETVRALTQVDNERLAEVVRGQLWAPLATAVAAGVLLRAEAFGRLHDWLRRLADEGVSSPDIQALWFVQRVLMARRGRVELSASDLDRAIGLNALGLPLTSDAFTLMAGRVEELDRAVAQARGSLPDGAHAAADAVEALAVADDERGDSVRALRDRFRRALAFYRSGGVSVAFAGPPETIGPGLLTGDSSAP